MQTEMKQWQIFHVPLSSETCQESQRISATWVILSVARISFWILSDFFWLCEREMETVGVWLCYPFSETFFDIVSLADVSIHLANVGHGVSVTSDADSIWKKQENQHAKPANEKQQHCNAYELPTQTTTAIIKTKKGKWMYPVSLRLLFSVAWISVI